MFICVYLWLNHAMDEFIPLTHRLADAAGNIARQYFRSDFDTEYKSDETPVTIADKEIERILREILEQERPQDGIFGEEFGKKESKSGLTWVLDPIDGTKSFTIGRANFGTLIALCEEDKPILGVIDQAITKERWIGGKDLPTQMNGTNIKTRACPLLSNAMMACTAPGQLSMGTPPLWQRLEEKGRFFVWGSDCYFYGLLAQGGLDLVIESGMATYDYTALIPIVESAGGHTCDWQGHPLTLTSDGTILALADISMKDEVLEIIQAAI